MSHVGKWQIADGRMASRKWQGAGGKGQMGKAGVNLSSACQTGWALSRSAVAICETWLVLFGVRWIQ
jgi:hypothetical protein